MRAAYDEVLVNGWKQASLKRYQHRSGMRGTIYLIGPL